MSDPVEIDLRPRKPPRIEPATETAVCRPAPRSWFSSRSTACCAVCSLAWSAASFGSYFARSFSDCESRPSRAPCASRGAEVGLGLARAGHELLRRTAPERHRLRLVEPVGVVLRPAAVGLGVARAQRAARGTPRPRAAPIRGRRAPAQHPRRPPSRWRSAPSEKAASRAFSMASSTCDLVSSRRTRAPPISIGT